MELRVKFLRIHRKTWGSGLMKTREGFMVDVV